MGKKLIIMIAMAGLVSFAGMFAFAWLTKPAPQDQSPQVKQATPAGRQADLKLPQPEAFATSGVETAGSTTKKIMTEKRLKSLVCEVREKIEDYTSRLQTLETREQRLQMAHDTLKKDIEKLNNLRIDLASTVASLKSEQDKLLKSRVEIAKTEKDNLISIAATYDKMDAASASKILTNISQTQSGGDAVRILHYMTERTKAKLLAQLAISEPKLAAHFCQKLKQIAEEE